MVNAILAGLLVLGASAAEDKGLKDAPAAIAAPVAGAGGAGAFLRPGPASLAPKAPRPFLAYLGARFACEGDQVSTRAASSSCRRGAASWAALAEKRCRGKCARAQDADGLATLKCGVASFALEKPCP